ncbi:cation channel [Desmophyllum pertusum]|uniref:Cation channel n=1 Tax=Desmophyllum pertusum TaxID=174260 RepID=A0A9X0CTC2_9CNID|nr:cation channel [Desmophyllum pertusum]
MSLGGAAAASVLTGIVDAFKAVAQSNEVPLKTIVASLLLLGVKEFLNDIIFSCPEENFAIYGSLFICGPSIFLFCLSLLASSAFWQAVTGCCLLRCRGKKLLLLKAKNTVFVACLAPVIWLIYAFVEEDYYVCAKLGPLDAALAKANATGLKDAVNTVNKEFSQTKNESQLIAWGLVLGLVIVSTFFVTVYRLCLPIDPKLQGEYAFQEYEADKAVALFNEKVKPLAEQDAKQLIDSLFEKYKDKNHVEQIRVIEDQLKKMFPRHAGVLNGPYRVEKPDTKMNVPAPSHASEDVELQPMLDTIHA